MKKILLLIMASCMVVSIMGQMTEKSISICKSDIEMEYDKCKNSNSFGLGENQSKGITESYPVFQSVQTGEQQLDSIIYEDDFGNSSNLYIAQKKVYKYNSTGDILQFYDYSRAYNGMEMNVQKQENSYDSSGNQTLQISYKLDQITNLWISNTKTENIWNSIGQINQQINSNWNTSLNMWDIKYKFDYTYNSNGDKTQRQGYSWDKNLSQWTVSSKLETTYDTFDNPTLQISFYWDAIVSQWVNSYKEEYVYDSNGFRTKYMFYFWNASNNVWDIDTKMEYTYNSAGMLVKEIKSVKNAFAAGLLVPISKWEYSYDSDGRMTQSLGSWDRLGSGNMYLDSKYEFSFNSYGNEIQRVYYRWIEQTGQWDSSNRTSSYYSDVMDSGLTDITSQLKTFPNPTSDYITFNFNDDSHPASIEIFNMQGEKVIAQILSSDRKLLVRQLRHGIYLYKVNQNGKLYKGKVIIKE